MRGGDRYYLIVKDGIMLEDNFGNVFRFETEEDAEDYLEENELDLDGWKVEGARW